VAHIHRRLQAGFKQVAVVSLNRKKLNRIQQELTQGGSIQQPAGVGFYSPSEFISLLFDWAAEDPEGGIVEKGKPKKRNVALNAAQLTEGERKQREKEMLESLNRAMKRRPSA
jgi:hypothetical protein